MLIIGTIIGAGFASGRELVSFFGGQISWVVALSCAVLIFLICLLFLTIGSRIGANNISEVSIKIGGKFHIVFDLFLLVNNFIVLGGMLSGMDSLGNMVLPFAPLWSLGAAALCFLVVIRGNKGLMDTNAIIVPIIVISLVYMSITSITPGSLDAPFKAANILSILVYISMNMMLAGTVLTTLGKMKKSVIFGSSFAAAAVMGALMLLLSMSINSSSSSAADMPILEIAKTISPVLFGLIVAIIAISIFTTMMTAASGLTEWVFAITKAKKFSAFVVILGGCILSNAGFKNVVTYLYPVIGVLGLFYIGVGIMFVIKDSISARAPHKLFEQGNAKIHKPRKHQKNDGGGHNQIELKYLPAVNNEVTKTGA